MAVAIDDHTAAFVHGAQRSFRMQARSKQPAEEGQLTQHGLYRVRGQSQPEPHSVALVWFGDEQQPRVVCDVTCKGGLFRKDQRGNSICTHAIIVTKRLLRHPEEMTPPAEL